MRSASPVDTPLPPEHPNDNGAPIQWRLLVSYSTAGRGIITGASAQRTYGLPGTAHSFAGRKPAGCS